jgi:hypothetical protein
MAQAFQTTDQIAAPWLPGARLVAALLRALGLALAAVIHWRGGRPRIVVPPVSPEWLLEHERLSGQHDAQL